MNDDNPSIDYDRVSVFTGALLLSLVLQRFLETPARPFLSTTVLGSPLGLKLSASCLILLLVLGMTITAVTTLIKGHPGSEREHQHSFMHWVVPGLLNLALASWLNRIGSLRIWTAGLLVCAVVIPSALMVEFRAVARERRVVSKFRWWQMAVIHLAAVILFTQIFDARIRSLLSATAVALVATVLSARLFWTEANDLGRTFRYGGVVGLILGQMTWGLNYWRLSGLQGGLLLLLMFYISVGLIQQLLQGQLLERKTSRRILVEYGGVAIITLLVIALVAP